MRYQRMYFFLKPVDFERDSFAAVQSKHKTYLLRNVLEMQPETSCQIMTRRNATEHRLLVFDLRNQLHLPLTVFAKEAMKRSSTSTARVYLNAIVRFFGWLDRDQWQGRIH